MNLFRKGHPMAGERAPILARTPNVVASTGKSQTLRLYEPIDSWGGEWGVSAREFVAALDSLPEQTEEIRLLINSPGGEIWEGLAILNALRAHPAKVTAVVEGIAASSASFIACGVDELVMMKNSELFIHNAWGLAIGDAEVLRKYATDLEHEDRKLASIYAAKAGGDVEHWLGEMSGDKWYSADEAVTAKLADRVEGVGDAESAKARFDLSVFNRAPQNNTDHEPPSSPEPVATQPQKEIAMSDTLKAGLSERLGITDADASDETLFAALDGRLEEPTAPSNTVTVPDGTVLIDSEVLAGLQSDAAAGRQALEAQNLARREGIVEAALREGRISAASRDTWLAQIEANEEGATALINTLAKNTIPVEELGVTPAEASGDDAFYNSLFSEEKEA